MSTPPGGFFPNRGLGYSTTVYNSDGTLADGNNADGTKKTQEQLEKEQEQKYSASQGTGEDRAAGDGSGDNSFEPGLFNFGQIMEDFYQYEPEEGDQIGQLQKSAFQGNLVQTGFDAMLASALADQNAAIAQENMKAQADLEKLNTLDLMQAEFGYNELSKESNFNYENSFANSQYDRDVGMLAATGEQQRDNIREQSNQDRLTNIVEGEQQRLTDAQNIASAEKIATGQYASNDYRADVAADASKFGAQTSADASRDVATTQKESALGTTGLRTTADVAIGERRSKAEEFKATAAKEASTYGADRQLEGVKDTNITSTRNIRATGEETRSTQDNEQRLKARERADMSRYSRGLARAN
mgnify:FL=1